MHSLHGCSIVLEDPQRAGKAAHLVPALGVRNLKSAIARGEAFGQSGDGRERPRDAAADEEGGSDHCAKDTEADQCEDERGMAEDGVDIIDIDAATDDPAPGRKAFTLLLPVIMFAGIRSPPR